MGRFVSQAHCAVRLQWQPAPRILDRTRFRVTERCRHRPRHGHRNNVRRGERRVDSLTPKKRATLMARIRSTDTQPEKQVRSLLHRLGFRFRLHAKNLPGRPDIVLAKHATVVLVHGCFWHRHDCPRGASQPKTRPEYWSAKLAANVERDIKNKRALQRLGWRTLVVWECELRDPDRVRRRLLRHFRTD
jgi:DNA mismatch endonuclease (patch repair protein)